MNKPPNTGFTLIELMIVLTIVGFLMTMVGPLAVQSVEKAQAKQEMLMMKNWLRKVSARSFNTGQAFELKLAGVKAELYIQGETQQPLVSKTFESLFFQPQELLYNKKGFITPDILIGTYRERPLKINLSSWVNGEEEIKNNFE